MCLDEEFSKLRIKRKDEKKKKKGRRKTKKGTEEAVSFLFFLNEASYFVC